MITLPKKILYCNDSKTTNFAHQNNSYLENLNSFVDTIREKKESPILVKGRIINSPRKLKAYQKKEKALKIIKLEKNERNILDFQSFGRTFFLLRKFIRELKNISPLRKTEKLEEKNLKLIGNLYDSENEKRGKIFFILDPSMKLSIFFDFISLFALAFYFFIIPLQLAYNILNENNLMKRMGIIAMFILSIDLFRNFITAFYLKGSLVFSYVKISLHYITGEFAFDIFSLLPIFIHKYANDKSENKDLDYLLFFAFLKLKRFGQLFRRLESLLLTKKTYHHALSLLKLIVRIIFISHIFACLWNYMGLLGNEISEGSWIISNDLLDSSFQTQYLYSYYFVCVTMNTVGFGDITPTNPMEIGFCIIFIFFACGMFAYSINSVGMILSDISKEEDKFRKDLNSINDFMNEKNISFDLQMRVRKYLEYIKIEESSEQNEATTQTISKLSDSLREELLLEANGSILKKSKLFSSNFSEDTLRKTIMIMKEKRYMPGDIIIQKGEAREKNIFILKNGEVEIFMGTSDTLKSVQTCKKGEIFGEHTFFSGREPIFSVRSIDFTSAFTINKADFISIISKNAKDFERFNEIKDQIKIYNQLSNLKTFCYSCKSSKHLIETCPSVHYLPKKQIILSRYLYSVNQERKKDFKRRSSKVLGSFISWTLNKRMADKLKEQLENIDQTFFHEDEDEIVKLIDYEEEKDEEQIQTYLVLKI